MDMTKDDAKRELERLVREALRDKPTLPVFCARLRDAGGAGVWLYRRELDNGRGPQIVGASASLAGHVFKFSHLGQPPGELGLRRLMESGAMQVASARDAAALEEFFVHEHDSAEARRVRQAQGLAGAWAQEKEREEAARKLAASGRAVARELDAGLQQALAMLIVKVVNAALRLLGLDDCQLNPPDLQRGRPAHFQTPAKTTGSVEQLKAGLVVTERFRTALAANDGGMLRPLAGATREEADALEAALVARRPAKAARDKALAELPSDSHCIAVEIRRVEGELSKRQSMREEEALRARRALLIEKQRMIQIADVEAQQMADAERYFAGLPTAVAELEKQLWELEKSGAGQADVDAQIDAINMARKQHSLPSLDQAQALERQAQDAISEVERHRER